MKHPIEDILSVTFESVCIWIRNDRKASFTVCKTKYLASNVRRIVYLA